MAQYTALMNIQVDTKKAQAGLNTMSKKLLDLNKKSDTTNTLLAVMSGTLLQIHGSLQTATQGAQKYNQTLSRMMSILERQRGQISKLRQEMDGITKSTKKADAETKKLGDTFSDSSYLFNIAAFATVGFTIKRLIVGIANVTDQYILLENKTRLAIAETDRLEEAMQSVYNISQETRQPLELTVALYSRIGRNSKTLSKDLSELGAVVGTIQKAFQIGGATVLESRNAIVQFSQALASGRLQGDELRSILELAPELAKGIASSIGISVGSLRRVASEGKITTEILIASMQGMREKIDEEFGKIAPTIEQSLSMVEQAFIFAVGESENFKDANETLSREIQGFSKNLSSNKELIDDLGSVYKALAENADILAAAIVGLGSAFAALGVVGAVKMFAALANPVTGAVIGIASLAAGLFAYNQISSDSIDRSEILIERLNDVKNGLFGKQGKARESFINDHVAVESNNAISALKQLEYELERVEAKMDFLRSKSGFTLDDQMGPQQKIEGFDYTKKAEEAGTSEELSDLQDKAYDLREKITEIEQILSDLGVDVDIEIKPDPSEAGKAFDLYLEEMKASTDSAISLSNKNREQLKDYYRENANQLNDSIRENQLRVIEETNKLNKDINKILTESTSIPLGKNITLDNNFIEKGISALEGVNEAIEGLSPEEGGGEAIAALEKLFEDFGGLSDKIKKTLTEEPSEAISIVNELLVKLTELSNQRAVRLAENQFDKDQYVAKTKEELALENKILAVKERYAKSQKDSLSSVKEEGEIRLLQIKHELDSLGIEDEKRETILDLVRNQNKLNLSIAEANKLSEEAARKAKEELRLREKISDAIDEYKVEIIGQGFDFGDLSSEFDSLNSGLSSQLEYHEMIGELLLENTKKANDLRKEVSETPEINPLGPVNAPAVPFNINNRFIPPTDYGAEEIDRINTTELENANQIVGNLVQSLSAKLLQEKASNNEVKEFNRLVEEGMTEHEAEMVIISKKHSALKGIISSKFSDKKIDKDRKIELFEILNGLFEEELARIRIKKENEETRKSEEERNKKLREYNKILSNTEKIVNSVYNEINKINNKGLDPREAIIRDTYLEMGNAISSRGPMPEDLNEEQAQEYIDSIDAIVKAYGELKDARLEAFDDQTDEKNAEAVLNDVESIIKNLNKKYKETSELSFVNRLPNQGDIILELPGDNIYDEVERNENALKRQKDAIREQKELLEDQLSIIKGTNPELEKRIESAIEELNLAKQRVELTKSQLNNQLAGEFSESAYLEGKEIENNIKLLEETERLKKEGKTQSEINVEMIKLESDFQKGIINQLFIADKLTGGQRENMLAALDYLEDQRILLELINQQEKERFDTQKEIEGFVTSTLGKDYEVMGSSIASGVASAGPDAGRGISAMNAAGQAAAGGPVAMAGAFVMDLAMSNEKVADAINEYFAILIEVLEPFFEVLASLQSAINRLVKNLIDAIDSFSISSDTGGELGYLFGGGFTKKVESFFGGGKKKKKDEFKVSLMVEEDIEEARDYIVRGLETYLDVLNEEVANIFEQFSMATQIDIAMVSGIDFSSIDDFFDNIQSIRDRITSLDETIDLELDEAWKDYHLDDSDSLPLSALYYDAKSEKENLEKYLGAIMNTVRSLVEGVIESMKEATKSMTDEIHSLSQSNMTTLEKAANDLSLNVKTANETLQLIPELYTDQNTIDTKTQEVQEFLSASQALFDAIVVSEIGKETSSLQEEVDKINRRNQFNLALNQEDGDPELPSNVVAGRRVGGLLQRIETPFEKQVREFRDAIRLMVDQDEIDKATQELNNFVRNFEIISNDLASTQIEEITRRGRDYNEIQELQLEYQKEINDVIDNENMTTEDQIKVINELNKARDREIAKIREASAEMAGAQILDYNTRGYDLTDLQEMQISHAKELYQLKQDETLLEEHKLAAISALEAAHQREIEQLERKKVLEDAEGVQQKMEEILGNLQSTMEKIGEFVEGLFQQVEDLLYSEFNLDPAREQLERASKDYDDLLKKAASPEATQEDIKELQDFVDTYLETSRDVYKSSTRFQEIFQQVLGDLSALGLSASVNMPAKAIEDAGGEMGELKFTELSENDAISGFQEKINKDIDAVFNAITSSFGLTTQGVTDDLKVDFNFMEFQIQESTEQMTDNTQIAVKHMLDSIDLSFDQLGVSLDGNGVDISTKLGSLVNTTNTSFSGLTNTIKNVGSSLSTTSNTEANAISTSITNLSTTIDTSMETLNTALIDSINSWGLAATTGSAAFATSAQLAVEALNGALVAVGDVNTETVEDVLTALGDILTDLEDILRLSQSAATDSYLTKGNVGDIMFTYLPNLKADVLSEINKIEPGMSTSEYKAIAQKSHDGIVAAANYSDQARFSWANTVGMAKGGPVEMMAGGRVPSTDTVPAMLTPGEFVIKRSSASSIGLENLNRLNTLGASAMNGGSDPEMKTLMRELIQAIREDSAPEVHVYTDMRGEAKAAINEFRTEMRERSYRQGSTTVNARYI